ALSHPTRTFDFFFQAEDGIRDFHVTGVQTCALPILRIDGVEDVRVGAQQRVEAGVVLITDLAGAQAGDVDAVARGAGDGAAIRRLAAVPVAQASRIDFDPVGQARRLQARAQGALCHRRAANVPEADNQQTL